MAAMTLLNQDRMVAGRVAPAARWLAADGGARPRVASPTGIAPVTVIATHEVKPFHGYARRPLEGSS